MKVCIIGAGLTSLTLSKALINRGLYVDILNSKKIKKISQTRTLGISKSNIQYFNKNISNIKKIMWEIKHIKIFTENSIKNEIINFSESRQQLFSIIHNQKLIDQLTSELKKNKKFNLKKSISYKNLVKKKYTLIINCDPNHEITKKFFSKNIEKNYKSSAYTTVIDHEKIDSNFTATQVFTRNGPIAFLPISNSSTSIVCSLRKTKDYKNFEIENLIKKFNPKYEIKKVQNISCFELKSSIPRKYYYDNILAFGDLLHKLHPLAGQGFNMSIRDIIELSKIIDKQIKLGLNIDKTICMDFQKKTQHKNFIFSKGVDWVYEIFNFESKIKSDIFIKMISLIGKNNSLNKVFKKFADTGLQA